MAANGTIFIFGTVGGVFGIYRIDPAAPGTVTLEQADTNLWMSNLAGDAYTAADQTGTKVYVGTEAGIAEVHDFVAGTGIASAMFSTDGTEIFVFVYTGVGNDADLYRMDADGSGAALVGALAAGGGDNTGILLGETADGYVLWATQDGFDSFRIRRTNLSTGASSTVVTPAGGALFSAGLSPDGAYLAVSEADNAVRIYPMTGSVAGAAVVAGASVGKDVVMNGFPTGGERLWTPASARLMVARFDTAGGANDEIVTVGPDGVQMNATGGETYNNACFAYPSGEWFVCERGAVSGAAAAAIDLVAFAADLTGMVVLLDYATDIDTGAGDGFNYGSIAWLGSEAAAAGGNFYLKQAGVFELEDRAVRQAGAFTVKPTTVL